MRKSSILLVDDHALLRHGLASIIRYQKDMEVVAEAENGKAAIPLASKHNPDLIIMDLMMPVMDGVEATKRIREKSPTAKILILTSFGTSADVSRAISAGAVGAVMKDTPDERLLVFIRQALDGRHVFSPEIAHMIRNEPPPPELTERQLEILHSITRGLTNRDIAKQFGLKPSGVRVHLDAILQKLGAATRAEAVAIALRKHLLKI